jgi:hypothetical protein
MHHRARSWCNSDPWSKGLVGQCAIRVGNMGKTSSMEINLSASHDFVNLKLLSTESASNLAEDTQKPTTWKMSADQDQPP